jgi:hypothetical protein
MGCNYDLEWIKKSLAVCALEVCQRTFPNGKRVCNEFAVGSLAGEPGNSLKIKISGPKVGVWKDFATGECGSNLLDLLWKVSGDDFSTVCEVVAKWLNCPSNMLRASSKESSGNGTLPYSPPQRHEFSDLRSGTGGDIAALARSYAVSSHGIEVAMGDGVLKFFHSRVNGRCWSVVASGNFVRQDRLVDGLQFTLSDGTMAKARTIGSPNCPIGVPTDKPVIMLVEGSSDILAAYSLVCAENMENIVAPVRKF